MRVLLHICCAPCAIMPVAELVRQGFDLMGFFYNPNIQPYMERQRRLSTLKAWAPAQGLKLAVVDEYRPEEWFRRVAFREGVRCQLCYHQRLSRAAQAAKRGGFDAFTTTLLYSVRQKHQLIAEIGRALGRERGIDFLYQDFRPFWREGIRRSQAAGLYRQEYCGCLYSERDRFLGPPRSSAAGEPPPED